MELRLRVQGASGDELARGIAAAEEVFARANISSERAAEGYFAMGAWLEFGDVPDDQISAVRDSMAAKVWDNAVIAARDACCAGWPSEKIPASVELGLIDGSTANLDRSAAVDLLRRIAREDASSEEFDTRPGKMAEHVASGLDDLLLAQRLVDGVTVAHSALDMAQFERKPIEPVRKAYLDAVDALERATAP